MSEKRIFFIADTHFGSDAVRRYENRPFGDVREMDSEMIARWNSAVAPDDIVWHLGDFGAEGHEKEIVEKFKKSFPESQDLSVYNSKRSDVI